MRHLYRALAAVIALGVAATTAATLGPVAAADQKHRVGGPSAQRPNIVLITTDDMRHDDLRAMPFTRKVLARRGVTFTDAVSPFPLCCPARAEIVTGQYSHNNGVRGNVWPNGGYWALDRRHDTLPVWLRRQGYRTGFVGKYMNEYGKKPARARAALRGRPDNEVPPGWTHWYGSARRVYAYDQVVLNVDTPSSRPHPVRVKQYQTDYFATLTERMITSYHRSRKPFFIWMSQLAPHTRPVPRGGWQPPLPARQDRGDFSGASLPRSRAYRAALNASTADKHGAMVGLKKRGMGHVRTLHRRRLESLKSVDRAVKRVVRRLQQTGEYQRTILIFTSDNGYALGEHRYVGKNIPYEPALRVPMIVNAPGIKRRYQPGAAAATRVRVPATVSTIDIPATIVAASGAKPRRRLDGLDMMRPRANPDHGGGDRAVLIESGAFGSRLTDTSKFVGVRTNRWTSFGWNARPKDGGLRIGARELYDRRRDPGQVTNLQGDPRHEPVGEELHQLVQEMYDCRGAECVRGVDDGSRSFAPK